MNIAANFLIEIRDKNGNLKETARGAGTFTNLGKNFTATQLANFTGIITGNTAGINASTPALYLAESNNTAGIAVTSLVIPNEIVNGGLARAKASAQTTRLLEHGLASVVKTVTTTAIQTSCWSLNYDAYTSQPDSMIAYDSTPGAKNTVSGDTLTETWTITVT